MKHSVELCPRSGLNRLRHQSAQVHLDNWTLLGQRRQASLLFNEIRLRPLSSVWRLYVEIVSCETRIRHQAPALETGSARATAQDEERLNLTEPLGEFSRDTALSTWERGQTSVLPANRGHSPRALLLDQQQYF